MTVACTTLLQLLKNVHNCIKYTFGYNKPCVKILEIKYIEIVLLKNTRNSRLKKEVLTENIWLFFLIVSSSVQGFLKVKFSSFIFDEPSIKSLDLNAHENGCLFTVLHKLNTLFDSRSPWHSRFSKNHIKTATQSSLGSSFVLQQCVNNCFPFCWFSCFYTSSVENKYTLIKLLNWR